MTENSAVGIYDGKRRPFKKMKGHPLPSPFFANCAVKAFNDVGDIYEFDAVNKLMMTGWLPEVGRMWGCRQAYRSCVRSEVGISDLGGRGGRRRPFEGAEGASARRRGRHARLRGWGRGSGCGEVRERAGRALGGGLGKAEIQPRLGQRWGRGRSEIAISAMV